MQGNRQNGEEGGEGEGHSSEHYNNTTRSEIFAVPCRRTLLQIIFFYLKKGKIEKEMFRSYKAQERFIF